MALRKDASPVASKLAQFARSKLACLYDARRDILFVFRLSALNHRRPAISIDINGEFWVRQQPVTGEIDDIEIEDFERVFLVRHPQLASVWKQAKSYTGDDNLPNRTFIRQLMALLKAAHLGGDRNRASPSPKARRPI